MTPKTTEERRAARGITVQEYWSKSAPARNGRVFNVLKNDKGIGEVTASVYLDDGGKARIYIVSADGSPLGINGIDTRMVREVKGETIGSVTRWRHSFDSSDRGSAFDADLPSGVRATLGDIADAIAEHYATAEDWQRHAKEYHLAQRVSDAQQAKDKAEEALAAARLAQGEAEQALREFTRLAVTPNLLAYLLKRRND